MLQTFKFFILAFVLVSITACSAKKEPSDEPKGLTYKSSEIIVRQCQDISDLELSKLFEKHKVTIKKQVSPHLYIVTWKVKDRKVDEVIHELKSTTMFCGVDKYLEQ